MGVNTCVPSPFANSLILGKPRGWGWEFPQSGKVSDFTSMGERQITRDSPLAPSFADPKVKEAGGREGAQLLTSTAAGTGWHPSSCVVGPGEKHAALLGEMSSFQREYPGNWEKQAFLCKKGQTLQGAGTLSITARKPGISQCSPTWCSFTS